MIRGFTPLTVIVVLTIIACRPIQAQASPPAPVNTLKADVDRLRSDVKQSQETVEANRIETERLRDDVKKAEGVVLYLFAFVCALWAQSTGRNPWLWFFAGVLFSIFTALVIMYKNTQDRREARARS